MLIAQITDTHIKIPDRLAYRKVDTAAMLRACVRHIMAQDPKPDLIVHTGDLVDFGDDAEYAHLREILAPLDIEMLAIPGNHDARDAMRRAFPEHVHLQPTGFVQFSVRRGSLRIVGLDTVVAGQGGGELCADRLGWLEHTLALDSGIPTLVLMHHPPFLTGIAHMDRLGLIGRDAFSEIVARHPQVKAILCGHVHRMVYAQVGGRTAMICPSTAHQVALDLTTNGPSAFSLEPPGYMVHRWKDDQLVSHMAVVGAWPGPFPFFDANGQLID
ncbi:MAG: phosphodiesterase [Hyphomicrobiaceae bacterium]